MAKKSSSHSKKQSNQSITYKQTQHLLSSSSAVNNCSDGILEQDKTNRVVYCGNSGESDLLESTSTSTSAFIPDHDSDVDLAQSSICSELALGDLLDEDYQLFLDPELEGHLASLHDRLAKCSPENEEMQEKLQISFLIQKYSELLTKNTYPAKQSKSSLDPAEKSSNLILSTHHVIPPISADSIVCNCSKRNEELNAKEKEHLRNEISKVNNLKSRLESLCKELQTESRRIKEEGKKFLKNIETFTPISPSIPTDSHSELPTPLSLNLSTDRISFSHESDSYPLNARLNALAEQYENREKDYSSIIRLKDAQLQFSLAKYVSQQESLNQESIKVETLKSQVLNFIKTENELKRQLSVYVDKFKQVEETLSKSNELFMTFRKETEKMTKNLSKFEKENEYLKNKVATLNRNILEMAEEKTKNQKTTETLANQKMKLEVLCRTLQAERNEALAMVSKLKKAEQETAAVPASEPQEEPPL